MQRQVDPAAFAVEQALEQDGEGRRFDRATRVGPGGHHHLSAEGIHGFQHRQTVRGHRTFAGAAVEDPMRSVRALRRGKQPPDDVLQRRHQFRNPRIVRRRACESQVAETSAGVYQGGVRRQGNVNDPDGVRRVHLDGVSQTGVGQCQRNSENVLDRAG